MLAKNAEKRKNEIQQDKKRKKVQVVKFFARTYILSIHLTERNNPIN